MATSIKEGQDWVSMMYQLSQVEEVCRNIPQRGEIWSCNFGTNVGSEINKVRPCLIFQNNKGNKHSRTTIVIPITSREKRQPMHVELAEGYVVDSAQGVYGCVLTEQIKAVSKARLLHRIGRLSVEAMEKVEEAMRLSLGM
jgi:mRNA interferase MazF